MRLLLTILTVLLCAKGSAQQNRFSSDFTFSKQNFVDSIAIEYEQEQIFLPVSIDGRPYRFLLDTGAGMGAVFNDSDIDGVRPRGHIIAHDAIGRKDTVKMVTLPTLQIGDLKVYGYTATFQKRNRGRHQYDGIIGFDFLSKVLQSKIDIKNGLLVLTDRKDFFRREPYTAELKYKLNLHVPYLTIEPFEGFKETVLFDTGSRKLFAMNRAHFEEAEDDLDGLDDEIEGRSIGRHAIGTFGTEKRGEVVFLSMNCLKIGRLALKDVHALTTQGDSHLGAQFLEHAALVIDSKRKRMRLQTYASSEEVVVGNEQMDMAFVNDRNRPTVGLVWERGLPYQLGFREGDVIEKINDSDICTFADFARFRYIIGEKYVYTVRDRRGFLKTIAWERKLR